LYIYIKMAEATSDGHYKYGVHVFKWTDDHMSKQEAEVLRFDQDVLGNQVIQKLQCIRTRQKAESTNSNNSSPPSDDLYDLLCNNYKDDPILESFYNETHVVPDWVDWAQLQRGQAFFYRYALANIVGFALQGFVGENTASPSVVEVLVRTGGFSVRTLRRRLLATFQFILQVSESLDSLRAGGDGHRTAVRVRLLHAAVRNRITSLAESSPNYFDVAAFGVPLNALDSVHSIATFCCNHMWLQLPAMGIHPRPDEIADYIALYRYLAHLLGTPSHYFATPTKAKATMESMLVHQLHLTPTSETVCHNFLSFVTDLPPFNVSAGYIEAGSRRLNGDKFCDALGLGRPGWYAYACFQGQCWLLQMLAFAQQNFATLDAWLSAYFKDLLHWAIIRSDGGLGGGSRHRFKYVPQLGKRTEKEDAEWSGRQLSPLQRPVDLLFFGVFATVCLLGLVGLLLAWRFARQLDVWNGSFVKFHVTLKA
jgi:hypothetical protein